MATELLFLFSPSCTDCFKSYLEEIDGVVDVVSAAGFADRVHGPLRSTQVHRSHAAPRRLVGYQYYGTVVLLHG